MSVTAEGTTFRTPAAGLSWIVMTARSSAWSLPLMRAVLTRGSQPPTRCGARQEVNSAAPEETRRLSDVAGRHHSRVFEVVLHVPPEGVLRRGVAFPEHDCVQLAELEQREGLGQQRLRIGSLPTPA